MSRRNGVGPALEFGKCEAGRIVKSIGECKRRSSSRTSTQQQSRRSTGHVFGRDDLTWRGNVLRSGSVTLAEIKPDDLWPRMWRVATPDGVSDMTKLSRAVDAAGACCDRPQQKKARSPACGPFVVRVEREGLAWIVVPRDHGTTNAKPCRTPKPSPRTFSR